MGGCTEANLKETGWEGVESVYLFEDRPSRRAVVNTVTNIHVLRNAEFLV